MNKKLKKGLTVSSAAAMGMSIVLPTVSVIAAPAVTNGWVNQNGTWYYYSNGTLVKNGWAKDSKGWCFLSAVDGSWVQNGWAKDSHGWGYIENGYWVEHETWAQDSAGWCHINADGYWDGKPAVATKPGTTTTVAVSSVSAISANTIQVKFNTAVTDTSKVAFAVAQAGAAVTTTASWSADNTMVTLTKAANFTAGDYTVNVKNDTTDLGTTTVTFADQKVAKIQIISSKLGVVADSANAGQYKGYLTYKVLDQYGVDITNNSALAGSINIQSGYGNFDITTKGIATISALPQTILTAGSMVVTAYDTTSGVSTSATLTVSVGTGTLSDFQVGSDLTNVDNKVLTAGDNTDVFYLPFTATDISGNAVTDYNLIKDGLILTNGTDFTVSLPTYVTAKLVQDPSDSKKAAIEVRATNATIQMDMPVVITAMTTTGKSSTFSTTLKKQAALDKFTLLQPTDTVSSGQSVEIPFIALDQDGKQITDFSKLVPGGVPVATVSAGANAVHWIQNSDLSTKLKIDMPANPGPNALPVVITATTATGKFSTITVNVQKTTLANTLSLDASVLVPNMEGSATQNIDFGWDNGGLSVVDQYGRTVDMTTVDATSAGANYAVVANSSAPTVVSTSGYAAQGQHEFTITAGTTGAATVTFKLIKTADANDATVAAKYAAYNAAVAGGNVATIATAFNALNAIDTKTESMSVIADSDITGFAIDKVANNVFTSAANGAAYAANARAYDYKANPKVWGTTSSGSKVVLNGTTTAVTGAYVDNSNFVVTNGAAYDSVKVEATKFTDPAKTGATANLTVTLHDYLGAVKTVTTPITSSTTSPVASSVAASVDTSYAGISVDGDTVTVNMAAAASLNTLYITRWDNSNATGALATSRSPIYLYAKDQYGTKGMALASITKAGTSTVGDTGFAIAANGQMTYNTANITAGQYADVTAVSTNGLVKTIRIIFQ